MAYTDLPQFKTANEFSLFIEQTALDKKVTYLETVLSFCDTYKIDPEDVASKINKSLKEKLEQDFRDLNFLPKKAQLDV